jgi:hypothetical protein
MPGRLVLLLYAGQFAGAVECLKLLLDDGRRLTRR